MSDVDAGNVRGGIDWDISSYTKGMLQAETIAKLFPDVVTDFIAHPLLGLVGIAEKTFEEVKKAIEIGIDAAKEYAATAKEIAFANAEASESADALGLNVETYTALSAASRLVGADSMALSESIKFLNRNMADAVEGNKELRLEFVQMGVSVVDAAGNLRGSEDVFFDVADAIARMPDAAMRTRYAMDLMGRGAEDMLPFLSRGSVGIRQLMDEARRFGVVTSKNAAESGESFRHLKLDWDLLWEGIEKRATEPAIDLIAKNFDKLQASMFGISDHAADGIKAVFDWIGQHHTEIEKEFQVIEDASKKAFGWVVSHQSEIVGDFAEIGTESALAGQLLKTAGEDAYRAWKSVRDELASVTSELGDLIVKSENAAANERNKDERKAINRDGSLEKAHEREGQSEERTKWGFYSALVSPLLIPVGTHLYDMSHRNALLPPEATQASPPSPQVNYNGVFDYTFHGGFVADTKWLLGAVPRAIESLYGLIRPPIDNSNSWNQSPDSSSPSTTASPNVNATVMVDPKALAHEIGKVVEPALRKAVADAKQGAATAANQATQRKGL